LLEQLLCPLCAGGTCVVIPDHVRSDARRFARDAERHRITILDASPGMIESMLPDGRPPSKLETLISGGDVLPTGLAARLLSRGAARSVFNFYGPTEACIDATAHLVTDADLERPIPIGRPLPNYRVYVLNGALEPLPVGVVGEMYVAGPNLATAYLRQPALTASRFVADIGERWPGARMYRTGDLACWREDGNLEFHGRRDDQVEVNGTRIELGEVEAELARLPGVAQCAVVLSKNAPANCLVAYIVAPAGATPPDPATLRKALAARLPANMVPARFVSLPTLPLTREGKLDRRALPALTLRDTSRAVRNEEERLLCKLCADLLASQEIEIESNFFACGGNSLLAAQLINRVRASLGVELSFAQVFAAVNLEQLAALVCELRLSGVRGTPEMNAAADFEERCL